MDAKLIAESIVEEALRSEFVNDEVVAQGATGLEVEVEGDWIPTSIDVWRAWTGRRKLWGFEHHGPVYSFGHSDESPPYAGRRVCNCGKCQLHVKPELRPN
jgi:hypothetical protein